MKDRPANVNKYVREGSDKRLKTAGRAAEKLSPFWPDRQTQEMEDKKRHGTLLGWNGQSRRPRQVEGSQENNS
jgi:hypothetical protein